LLVRGQAFNVITRNEKQQPNKSTKKQKGYVVTKYHYLVQLLLLPIGIYFLMKKPKNVRNNNPLNIKESANWEGERKANLDNVFEEFKTPEYGFRAGYIILLQYLERGEDTIETILAKWAPANTDENNHTQSYIDYVADKIQLSSDEYVSPAMLPELMLHMSVFEGSKGFFTIEQSLAGADLAMQEDFVQSRLARIEKNSGWFGGLFA